MSLALQQGLLSASSMAARGIPMEHWREDRTTYRTADLFPVPSPFTYVTPPDRHMPMSLPHLEQIAQRSRPFTAPFPLAMSSTVHQTSSALVPRRSSVYVHSMREENLRRADRQDQRNAAIDRFLLGPDTQSRLRSLAITRESSMMENTSVAQKRSWPRAPPL